MMRKAVKLGKRRFRMFNWMQVRTNFLSIQVAAELFPDSALSETRVRNIERVLEEWDDRIQDWGEDAATGGANG